jgi:hypothetical protein
VAAGSAFAGLQSLGALGLGILGTALLPVAVGSGIIIGSIPWIKKWWSKNWSRDKEMFWGANDEIFIYVLFFLRKKVKIQSTNTKIKALILVFLVGGLFGWMIFLSDVFRFLEWRIGQLLIGVLIRLWKTRSLILELGQREAIVEAAHEEKFLF